MGSDNEAAAMRRAVGLAACGLGATSPNPVVGCVVLDPDGMTVGEGYHAAVGGPHAEVVALRAAGERAQGGTIVVTLEPCNHTGRTGPCTAAILAFGVARAVVGVVDPDPQAAGGAERLRAAGVEVEVGVLAAAAERVNEAWLIAVRRRRPFVIWKYAASLDGRVAAADGSSRWVTGVEARTDAHRLRARSDAVLVGAGTVRGDDPQLTVRLPEAARQPLRVIADTGARIPSTARVLGGEAPTLVAVAEDADATHLEPRAGVARLPRGFGGLDLRALARELYARKVICVLAEGGPALAASLLAEGLVDLVVGYIAPALIGGGGLSALGGQGAASIEGVPRLRFEGVTRVGEDLRVTARPALSLAAVEG